MDVGSTTPAREPSKGVGNPHCQREIRSCQKLREMRGKTAIWMWRREWESANSLFARLLILTATRQRLPVQQLGDSPVSRLLSPNCCLLPVFATQWHSKMELEAPS